jgi:hypothetical protein
MHNLHDRHTQVAKMTLVRSLTNVRRPARAAHRKGHLSESGRPKCEALVHQDSLSDSALMRTPDSVRETEPGEKVWSLIKKLQVRRVRQV